MTHDENNSKDFITWLLGVLFLGFVFGLISATAWGMFVEHYQDVPSIYILGGVWAVVLFLYFKNQENGLQKLKDLCGYTGLGFLFAIGSLVVLAMVFQWVLRIDITELRYAYRLEMLTWGGWIVGLYLYNKHKNETL